jgi:hypothetical protein
VFVTYCQPVENGTDLETLAILINLTEDQSRGSLFLLNRNGTTQILHNVPLDGFQVANGAHIILESPEYVTPPPAGEEEIPSAEEEETDTFTIGGSS